MDHLAELSPNQLAKRRQIVEAARLVLARDGLAGCTARAVADASPLTKSAIHYYFADMDQLVDEAMSAHITAFVAALRAAARPDDPPPARFWAVIAEYLATFRRMPGAARLWFGYWLDAVSRGRPEPAGRMHDEVIEFLTELLRAVGVDDAALRAHALLSYLLGTVARQAIGAIPFDEVQREIGALCLATHAGSV